jgi:DNA-binding beta-propeller fold protein YncE
MVKKVLILLLCLLALHSTAAANTPYKTFTRTSMGDMTETQTAYEPLRTMTKFGEESLKTPSDMRMGPDGLLYICDNGNKRILVVTVDGQYVREIGSKKTLKSPMGVFVSDKGNVYVADENARAVIEFDSAGEVVASYKKPEHPLFGADSPYKPVKVVVDKRGNLYILSTGNTSGIIQISPGTKGGEFLGYFGANTSIVSLLTRLRKELLNEQQLARTGTVVPPSVVNLSIDDKGTVYTVTQSNDIHTLRKLNVAGRNILDPDWFCNYPSAVATSSVGNIFMTDSNGYIYEFTSEGKILFIFGSYDDGQQRKGLFKSVTGIALDDKNQIYVLDEKNNSVQVFAPTEFCETVHRAFALFMDGKYTQSKEPWTEVLRMNSLFSYASIGLGEALYREGNFAQAMEAFRNGGNRRGFSDAFWELRSDWLHSHIGPVLLGIALLSVAVWIIRRVNRKTRFLAPAAGAFRRAGRVKLISQVGYSFRMLKNPYDACYGIRREERAGYLSALMVMGLFFALSVAVTYYSGFLYKGVPDGYFNLLGDFINIFGVYALLVICCYLVCTVSEGEATFKSLVIGAAYSLAPMLIALPLILVLSNVLTYNESVFITLIRNIAYGWTGLLLVLSVKYLNDYSFKKTFGTLLLTAFTALIAVALLFILYVLVMQLYGFIASVAGEVVYRFVKV